MRHREERLGIFWKWLEPSSLGSWTCYCLAHHLPLCFLEAKLGPRREAGERSR
jgi:hypothetical protein